MSAVKEQTKSSETTFITKAMTREIMTEREKKLFISKERVLEHHFGTFKQAGEALLVIRDQRLYREHYGTFEEYCRERWDMSKTQANRLISAAQVVGNIETPENAPFVSRLTEGSVRPLTGLKPETQKKVVAKLAQKSSGENITAKLVEDTAREIAPKEVPKAKKTDGRGGGGSDLVRRSEFLDELAGWEKTHKANGTFEQLTVPAVLKQVRQIINSL